MWRVSSRGCPSRSVPLPLTAPVTYNSLGHLSCSLCNAPVKSELLWQTHVLGKQHREVSGRRAGAGGAAALGVRAARRRGVRV